MVPLCLYRKHCKIFPGITIFLFWMFSKSLFTFKHKNLDKYQIRKLPVFIKTRFTRDHTMGLEWFCKLEVQHISNVGACYYENLRNKPNQRYWLRLQQETSCWPNQKWIQIKEQLTDDFFYKTSRMYNLHMRLY